MFAVICNQQYFDDIEGVLNSRDEQIAIKAIDNDVDIVSEIEQIKRLPITHLILDITSVQDSDKLLMAIHRYRIMHDHTQIIIVAPNFEPGDEILHSLVTMSIHNIIAPSSELSESLIKSLNDVLDHPFTYKNAVKWINNNAGPYKENDIIKTERVQAIQSINTIKELIGTISIAVSSLQHGAGATFNALTIARFLTSKGLRVAIVEFKKINDYGLIYLPRKDSYNSYHFRYENFDIFANDGEILPDGLLIEAMSSNFNYLILDTGLLFQYDLNSAVLDKPVTQIKKYEKGPFYNDFMKSDFKIVNSFASTQYADSLEYFVNYLDAWNINDLQVLFSFADEKQVKSYDKLINSNTFLTPYNSSAILTDEQKGFYEGLLTKIMPKNVINKGGMSIGNMIKSLVNR